MTFNGTPIGARTSLGDGLPVIVCPILLRFIGQQSWQSHATIGVTLKVVEIPSVSCVLRRFRNVGSITAIPPPNQNAMVWTERVSQAQMSCQHWPRSGNLTFQHLLKTEIILGKSPRWWRFSVGLCIVMCMRTPDSCCREDTDHSPYLLDTTCSAPSLVSVDRMVPQGPNKGK